MDYLFENLGDERFQEFCNSLITKEFPDSQSYPVGQPDGGRDSIAYFMHSVKKEFIVFQVKFVRNPNTIPNVHKWFTDIIKEEAPKIEKLIPLGAKKFYLLTNVRGTAHLNNGSKDIVNQILEEKISIPSLCWWRDDISRIAEKDPLFKWSFPEILNGQDILNSVLFANINENKERRESIIKSYLSDQYLIDDEVKFRQIDLHNKLLDLFTDLPIRIKKFNQRDKKLINALDDYDKNNMRNIAPEEFNSFQGLETIKAASFLLYPKVQNEIERILIEGGPGQGKSTISQYICQVHRVRLLNKHSDLELLPKHIRHTPVRFPFKIDLRHVALWVENKNPYQGMLSEQKFKLIWKNSLQSFLIGHISYHSQSDTFNSDDLFSILKNSSVLFVFDGFDEIADIQIRKDVIEFINKGINRIKENSKSIQIVITSRPAAFSDTIVFSEDEYPHFQLTDITTNATKEYVDKWTKASKLNDRESNEIKKLVNEKLQLPHLKELAKSPMQLAIFISLLKTRGESLPNKRTAMYDSYIELFFNRESEKNSTIRDHRDLIIDIHQYLAWILHSEAEVLGNSGSISVEKLQKTLHTYLEKEGHKTEIATHLFHVMQERVCAIVSRVQGTYEFEVQPLREYFCAKFLYNTSPYSPAGMEKTGTKPERFNTIARNFYWHNVVRFFAGCFDKGELPMLIQELNELQKDELLKYTNYPSLITSQILSDYVFTQYPNLLKDVAKIISKSINIGSILNQNKYSSSELIFLPEECGRSEVFSECFEQLKQLPKQDYANDLIEIILNNPLNTEQAWINEVGNYSGLELVKWLDYGLLLQILHKLDHKLLHSIIKSDSIELQKSKLQTIINGNRIDVVEKNKNLKITLLEGILDNEIIWSPKKKLEHSIQYLSAILHPVINLRILDNSSPNSSYFNHISQVFRSYNDTSIPEFNIEDEIDKKINFFINQLECLMQTPTSSWRSSISNWEILVENIITNFGENWSSKTIAIIAAGIKSKDEKFEEFDDLSDSKKSLCKRTRCARLKSGNISYWEKQLGEPQKLTFKLLTFFTWCTSKTIIHLYPKVSEIMQKLNDKEISIIIKTLKKTQNLSTFTSAQTNDLINFFQPLHDDNLVKYIVSLRFAANKEYEFVYKNINTFSENLKEEIGDIKFTYLVDSFIRNPNNDVKLSEIKKHYQNIKRYKFNHYIFHAYHLNSHYDYKEIPIELAQKIMLEPKLYPRIVATIAEKSCRHYANKKTIAVGEIASTKNWFE